MPPLTKFWFIRVKSSTSIDSPSSKETWTKGLNFCSEMSGTESAGHTLWQDVKHSSDLVFISGYPSQESADAADDAYIKANMKSMMDLVEHKAIFQLALDVTKDLPMNAKVLGIQEFTTTDQGGSSEEGLEEKVTAEQRLLLMFPDCQCCVIGWDIWPGVVMEKQGLPREEGTERSFVRVTGWNCKVYCECGLLVAAARGRKPTKTSILRQLMGWNWKSGCGQPLS
jgi:hypothetical protein